MTTAKQADPRLKQFRDTLSANPVRRVFDILQQRVQASSYWHCVVDDAEPPTRIRCVHRVSGEAFFSLDFADGHLTVSLDEAGVARVPGGLPALESGLGAFDGSAPGRWSLRVARPVQADTLGQLLFTEPGPVERGFRPRHWRMTVNHAAQAQIEGGYLWAPKTAAARPGQRARSGISRILTGDVVFARSGRELVAIGVALEPPRSSPDPSLTSTDGWLVPVRFDLLVDGVTPVRETPARSRRPTAVRSDAPLTEMSEDEAQSVRRSLDHRVETFEERVRWETDGALIDQAIEAQIWLRTDMAPIDKRNLIAARQGRGPFRDNVERFEHGCRVTGVLDRRYLRATHIKPWRDASDAERLDGGNGLLLSPHLIMLFARGQISFSDDGTLLISRHLNPYVQNTWIPKPLPASRAFRAAQLAYLDYHRTQLFERVEVGRRQPAPNP